MTPKQKANELFFKYYEIIEHTLSIEYVLIAKKCAIIAVDELINTHLLSEKNIFDIHPVDYWAEVKQEIENYDRKNI
jgi:hypothetical protein